MKQTKQTFLYFTRIIKMSDKKSANKDMFMLMKNFEVQVQEDNQNSRLKSDHVQSVRFSKF